MKIVLSANRFVPPFTGGVDVYADRLARALNGLGHEVILLAFDPDGARAQPAVHPETHEGLRLWRFHFSLAARSKDAFDRAYDRDLGCAVQRVLEQEQADLFVALNFYLSTMASVEAAKALGLPVVHIATDFVPVCRRATFIRWNGVPCTTGESVKDCAACFLSHRALGRVASAAVGRLPEETILRWANHGSAGATHPLRVLRPYLRQASTTAARLATLRPLREAIDLVLAPTQYTRQVFLANGFGAGQVHYLPFAVEPDHPLARVAHVPAGHTRFLFIGRLMPYKGAHLLVEAFNKLASPQGATLAIYGAAAGDASYFDRLQAAMAANERIHFGGTIAAHELARAFAEADYFVLPSVWHENSPLILLDALQAKTPVLASDIGGVTDVIADGQNGLLFPMGDGPALQRLMQRVIDRPELRPQLSAGRKLPDIVDYASTMLELVGQGARR